MREFGRARGWPNVTPVSVPERHAAERDASFMSWCDPWPDMDALDLAILRELSRGKVFWWGGLDPRVSTEVLARRLKVAGSTVRARLAGWEESGFLRGYDVIPNPRLFGARLAGGALRVEHPGLKARVLDDLALVDGVKGAIDHVGPWIVFILISQNERDLERVRRLLQRLPGVAEVSKCESYEGPATTAIPSPLDWRLLAALRATPQARVNEIASRMGVSARTFTRRYEALVKHNAVLFWLLLDFGRSSGVVARVIVEVAEGVRTREVAAALRERFPDAMELWTPTDVGGPDELDLVLHRHSVPAMEDATLEIMGIPGVASAEALYPRGVRAYPDWVESRISAVVGEAQAARARRVAE